MATVVAVSLVFLSTIVVILRWLYSVRVRQRQMMLVARRVPWYCPEPGVLFGMERLSDGATSGDFESRTLLQTWCHAHGTRAGANLPRWSRYWRPPPKWAVCAPPNAAIATAMGPAGPSAAVHSLEHELRALLNRLKDFGVGRVLLVPYVDFLAAEDLIDERQAASANATAQLNRHLESLAAENGAELLDIQMFARRGMEFTRAIEGSADFNNLGHAVVAACESPE